MPYLRENISSDQFKVEDGIRPGDLRLVERKSGTLFYARVLPFRPTLDTVYNLRQDISNFLPEPPAKAVFFYREIDRHDQRVSAMEWVLAPERFEEIPSRYRVLPYTGDSLDLRWLT